MAVVRVGALILFLSVSPFAAGAQTQAPAEVVTPPQQTQPQAPGATVQPEAPAALPDELARAVQRFSADLEQIEKSVERDADNDEALGVQRGALDGLQATGDRILNDLRPRHEAVRLQVEKLGKPPAANAPPEAPPVAAERARLAAIATQVDGAIKTTELGLERARQLVARIQNLRYAIFARDLLRRTPNALRPDFWRRVGEEMPQAVRQLSGIARSWWLGAEGKMLEVWALLAAGVCLYFGLGLWRRHAMRSLLDTPRDTPPSFFRRAAMAIWVAPLTAMPAVAAVAVLIGGLDLLDLIPPLLSGVFQTLVVAALTFAAFSALAEAILQPRRPSWRLVEFSDLTSARLKTLARAIAAIFAADLILQELVRLLYLPLHFGVALTFVMNLIFAALLIQIVRTPFQPEAADAPVSVFAPRWFKLPLLALAVAIVGASFLGYLALGRFIAAQVLVTGAGLIALILLHLANNAIAYGSEDSDRSVGRLLQDQFGLDADRRSQLSRMLAGLLDFALALIAIPLFLLTWGFASADILDWLKQAVFGFEVGQFRISLARILMAALLFLGLLLATRLVQRWLSGSVLQPPRVDAGIANSIHTGVGYAGISLAGLLAVSYAGLDLSNLAIVAGALSVGIGFGLQSVVNNFVSGLILLVERPIKVGDWIVVKDLEGYVRRISVRATEIETFDRASLIVPNSELITGTVLNWTHRNAMGRLIIRVGVAHDSDIEKVHEVLSQVARGTKGILQQPEPRVVFDDLGASALQFSLRVFLADVNTSLDVQTELRTGILKGFRAAGIEIPNSGHDIYLRDLDLVRKALASAAEARRRDQTVDAAAEAG